MSRTSLEDAAAFPRIAVASGVEVQEGGLTKLEWYAGLSLSAIRTRANSFTINPEAAAKLAIDDAKAMIKALAWEAKDE